MDSGKKEGILRFIAIILLVLTALLVRYDTQTKLLFHVLSRKATFRDLNALFALVWVDTAAAGYNMVQLIWPFFYKADISSSSNNLAWLSFLLDQAVAYTVFGANSAAAQASMLAVTGETSLQWMKLCNRFTRFCYQIAGALLCGYAASLVMAFLSSCSAYTLFRLYSPK